VVPVAEGRPALGAGVATVRQGRPAAARRAVLGRRLDERLAAELREAVAGLGGRVIVRSSSPLESDPRWSGAFSSVAEVGPDDVVAAVRSCWSSAFAVDPLGRLEACGLPPEALELGILLQPEIRPVAGGVARVTGTAGAGAAEVTIEGVLGHPGPLLAGWAEGASARVPLPPTSAAASMPATGPPLAGPGAGGPARSGQPGVHGHDPALAEGATVQVPGGPAQPGRPGGVPSQPGEGELAALVGTATVTAVADLAARAWWLLSDDVIEWAADESGVWLLQSQRSGVAARGAAAARLPTATNPGAVAPAEWAGLLAATNPGAATPVRWAGGAAGAAASAATSPGPGGWADGLPTARASMPLLAAAVLSHGEHVPGRPGAPGTAAGRLLACRPHERRTVDCADAILLVDQPVPALAPLLFSARGVIARTGAAGSHLAQVARSLGVPMVLGCRPELVTGTRAVPDGAFLAAIDGSTGDAALLPAAGANLAASPGPGVSALSGLHHPASARPAPGPSGQRI